MRNDEGGGLLGGSESPHPQLGWFKGERRALPFHPGQEEEKKASFAPQVLLNPSCIPLLPESKASR